MYVYRHIHTYILAIGWPRGCHVDESRPWNSTPFRYRKIAFYLTYCYGLSSMMLLSSKRYTMDCY
uniref:Uncharacterized protein n=1 Tax=Arundo donax TaxID=35708 RepID=A0A0A8Z396_ARUDO